MGVLESGLRGTVVGFGWQAEKISTNASGMTDQLSLFFWILMPALFIIPHVRHQKRENVS